MSFDEHLLLARGKEEGEVEVYVGPKLLLSSSSSIFIFFLLYHLFHYSPTYASFFFASSYPVLISSSSLSFLFMNLTFFPHSLCIFILFQPSFFPCFLPFLSFRLSSLLPSLQPSPHTDTGGFQEVAQTIWSGFSTVAVHTTHPSGNLSAWKDSSRCGSTAS